MLDMWYQQRQAEVVRMTAEDPVSSGQGPAARPVSESVAWSAPGVRVLVSGVVTTLAGIALLILHSAVSGDWILIVAGILILILAALQFQGLTPVVVQEARVVQLFGRYRGTIRHTASSYPYTSHDGSALSLRDNAEEITQRLSTEIAERVRPAGVHIVESRLTRLSYAAEIAQAMLRQQQASAVVGARQRIVEGAVGMVRLALQRLEEEGVVELDEERKAAMVSNLLVVLCSEQATQQVVNTGSLYQ